MNQTDVVRGYELHVHNDLDYDVMNHFKIPFVFKDAEIFIIQEDRCVFVGNRKMAIDYYNKNNGKYCKSAFPL